MADGTAQWSCLALGEEPVAGGSLEMDLGDGGRSVESEVAGSASTTKKPGGRVSVGGVL